MSTATWSWSLDAGMNPEKVRLCCYVIKQEDYELCTIFRSTVQLIAKINNCITRELESIEKDLNYWKTLSECSVWEIYITKLNSSIYRRVSFATQGIEWDADSNIQRNIYILNSTKSSLLALLTKVFDAAGYIQKIYLEINSTTKIDSLTDLKDKVPLETSRQIQSMARDSIRKCLRYLSESIVHIEGVASWTKHPSLHSSNEDIDEKENSTRQLRAIFIRTERCAMDLIKAENDPNYPLGLVSPIVQKPSIYERHWLRNTIGCVVAIAATKTLYNMYQDGRMANAINFAADRIQAFYVEHIVEPITDLANELFERIQSRDEIVSREDFEKSKEAFHRMLEEFSHSTEGMKMKQSASKSIGNAMKNTLKSLTNSSKESVPSESGNNNVDLSTSNAAIDKAMENAIAANSSTIASVNSAFSPEEALDALMRTYEEELQNPISGLVRGNLLTAILIQIQKLKMHTEGAMLKLDKVLASNQLTIAVTAAMPAFFLIGASLTVIRRWLFSPPPSKIKDSKYRLRRVLNEIDKCFLNITHSFSSSSTVILHSPPTVSVQSDMSLTDGALMQSPTRPANVKYNSFLDSNIEKIYYRGLFHFHLSLLRRELFQYHSLSVVNQSSLKIYQHQHPIESFVEDYNNKIGNATNVLNDQSYNGSHSVLRQNLLQMYAVLHRVGNILFKKFPRMTYDIVEAFARICFANTNARDDFLRLELHGLIGDINDLETCDSYVSLTKKLHIISRMKSGYECFLISSSD